MPKSKTRLNRRKKKSPNADHMVKYLAYTKGGKPFVRRQSAQDRRHAENKKELFGEAMRLNGEIDAERKEQGLERMTADESRANFDLHTFQFFENRRRKKRGHPEMSEEELEIKRGELINEYKSEEE